MLIQLIKLTTIRSTKAKLLYLLTIFNSLRIVKTSIVELKLDVTWTLFPARDVTLNPPMRALKIKSGTRNIVEQSQSIFMD